MKNLDNFLLVRFYLYNSFKFVRMYLL